MQGQANYEIVVSPAAQQVVLTPGDPNSTTELPAEQVGVAAAEVDIVASGGTSPYTFNVGGNLPPGMSAASNDVDTLRISGTPTEAGTFDFSVTAVDASGAAAKTASFRRIATK